MKYFELSEFDDPTQKGSGAKMQDSFLYMLDEAREVAGVPFKINSGYRTKKHNKAVGGKQTSSHTKGMAADIHCNDSYSRIIIIHALIETGFRRIGIGKTFIHVDSDLSKNNALWLY